ncbi:MAG: MinD/ParA family protein [Burkholderiales bacterium]
MPNPLSPDYLASLPVDQAAGLRSLLSRSLLRILPVLSCDEDRTGGVVAGRLALALARNGRNVVLLDGTGAAAAAVGASGARDLVDLLHGRADFDAVAVAPADGLRCLRAMQGLPELIAAGAANDEFFAGFLRLENPPDTLVMTLPYQGFAGSSWLPGGGEVLLLCPCGERGLTGAYAVIKRLVSETAIDAAPDFRLLINGASGEREARVQARHLADTARRFLGVTASYAGNLPRNSLGQALGVSASGGRHPDSDRTLARLAGESAMWRLTECAAPDVSAALTH